ncbi:MAG: tetratricopeptide repeat protein [Nitrospirota bacterium]|nr:tetratricopeptide repeat protein [Nitrospirota bacterium]
MWNRPFLLLIAVAFLHTLPLSSGAQEQAVGPAERTLPGSTQELLIYQAGETALKKKDYKTAAEKLSTIVNKYPFSEFYEESIYGLGNALFSSGAREEGITLLEKALVIYPSNWFARQAHILAGDYYYRTRQKEDALRHYTVLLEQFEGPSLRDLVYLRIGILKMEMGDLEGATKDLEHLINEYPQSPHYKEGLVSLVWASNQVGRAYRGAELYDSHQQDFASMADDGKGLLFAMDSYLALKLYDRAIDVLAEFDRVYPNSRYKINALARRGQALMGRNDLDGAEKALRQALSISRKSAEVVLVLATLYSEKGKIAEALATLGAFPATEKNREGVLMSLLQGKLYFKTNKQGEAIKAYSNALAVGESLAATDAMVKEALPRIHVGMADTLYAQGKYPEAAQAYRKAKDSGATPEDLPWILYRTGECLEKVGDSAKAAESYQELLSATTDPLWTGRANNRLEGIEWAARIKEKKEKSAQ